MELKKIPSDYGAIGQILTYMALLYYADKMEIKRVLASGEWLEEEPEEDAVVQSLASEGATVDGFLVFPFTGEKDEVRHYLTLAKAVEFLNSYGLSVKLLELKPFKDAEAIALDVWASVHKERRERLSEPSVANIYGDKLPSI